MCPLNQTEMHHFDDTKTIPILQEQLGFEFGAAGQPESNGQKGAYFSAPSIDLGEYDHIVLCMSGGKDSIACLLRLIDMGADLGRVELWHHLVDGREGSSLMDWAFSEDYNRRLAEAFGLPIYFSWLEGGFEG
jgi:hypothetical protein